MSELTKLWGAAMVAAAVATGARLLTASLDPLPQALIVIPVFGVVYLGLTWVLDLPEAAVIAGRLRGRRTSAP